MWTLTINQRTFLNVVLRRYCAYGVCTIIAKQKHHIYAIFIPHQLMSERSAGYGFLTVKLHSKDGSINQNYRSPVKRRKTFEKQMLFGTVLRTWRNRKPWTRRFCFLCFSTKTVGGHPICQHPIEKVRIEAPLSPEDADACYVQL